MPRETDPQGLRPPVLIVNGFSFFPLFGLPIKECRDVYRQGGRMVAKIDWALENMLDVTTYAGAILRRTVALIGETKHQRVSLVSWSMGGIASFYAMRHLGLHSLVDSFVAFGSPFGGSDLSYPAVVTGLYSKTAIQLMPGSQFLKDLTAGELPGKVRYVSIGGDRDLICPSGSARLPGAENIVGPYGHEDFMISVGLHRLIASHLDGVGSSGAKLP